VVPTLGDWEATNAPAPQQNTLSDANNEMEGHVPMEQDMEVDDIDPQPPVPTGESWSIVHQSESTCLCRCRLECQGRPNYVFRQFVPYPPILFHVYRKLWRDPHPCPVVVVTRAVKIAWYSVVGRLDQTRRGSQVDFC
jgi:hypothetical protein